MSSPNISVRASIARRRNEQQELDASLAAVQRDMHMLGRNEQLGMQQQVLIELTETFQKPNTKKSYDPKILEFQNYCNTIYRAAEVEGTTYTVTNAKVYDFLCYTAFRPKRQGGKRKNGEEEARYCGAFNEQEYRAVKDKYFGQSNGSNAPRSLIPLDSLSFESVNAYKSAIASFYTKQRANHVNTLAWNETIWQPNCQYLMDHVRKRRKHVKKITHAEKTDDSFVFFKADGKIVVIEKALWMLSTKERNTSLRAAFTHVRNRFTFLFTTCGILRGESIVSAELSDILMINWRNPRKDPYNWDALIMNIINGKTNREKTLYGRAMRHKDVLLCAIGSLGMYLLVRFALTKEFDEVNCPDFRENSAWYDIKLLIGYNACNPGASKERSSPMKAKSYYSAMVKVLANLDIPSNHYEHIGRVIGAQSLQILEVEDDDIRQLGNWQVTVRDLAYSTKLPLKAMRYAAGHIEGTNAFICPRSQVPPPASLAKEIFSFADEQLNNVREAMNENRRKEGAGNYLGSAHNFLEMLIRLRTIILQDAAAMTALHPERVRSHPVYNCPTFRHIFHSESFKNYAAQMRTELEAAVTQHTDLSVDHVLPGVLDLMRGQQEETRRIRRKLDDVPTLNDVENLLVRLLRGATAALTSSPPQIQQQSTPATATPARTDDSNPPLPLNHILDSTHSNIRSLYDEWFGIGRYANVPIPGGLDGCMKRWRAKWRTEQQKQRVSRQQRLCEAVNRHAAEAKKTVDEVCEEWDPIYLGPKNRPGLNRLVQRLVEMKLIPKG